jgi:hypothetical protein
LEHDNDKAGEIDQSLPSYLARGVLRTKNNSKEKNGMYAAINNIHIMLYFNFQLKM